MRKQLLIRGNEGNDLTDQAEARHYSARLF